MPINETISAAIYIGAYTAQMLIARMLPNGTSFETLNQFTTFTGLSADDRKWRSNLAVEPEVMAVGPLSFGCLSLLTKHSVYESVDSIAAIPQKTAALVELSRNLVARSKESVTGLPGIDRQMAPTIASGAMILRCALELTGSYEFRVTPYGICAGMLRSPSYLFTQTNI